MTSLIIMFFCHTFPNTICQLHINNIVSNLVVNFYRIISRKIKNNLIYGLYCVKRKIHARTAVCLIRCHKGASFIVTNSNEGITIGQIRNCTFYIVPAIIVCSICCRCHSVQQISLCLSCGR